MLSDDFSTGTVSLVLAITGHRDLYEADVPGFEDEIRKIFQKLKTAYRNTPLLLLSGLAEGADQIAVRVAQEKDIDVPYVAILPLPEDLYRTDFTTEASDLEFSRLCRGALRCISLPLVPGITPEMAAVKGSARDRQYERLGEYLVRYSQILIAIHDPDRARKPGGTADVVGLKLQRDSRSRRIFRARMNAEGAGPVYMLAARTISSGNGESPALKCERLLPHGTTWAEYAACYTLLDRFNYDVAHAGKSFFRSVAKSRKYLFVEGDPIRLSGAMEWVVRVYSRADALAVRFSERGLRIWLVAFFMLALAGLFLALSHFPGGSENFLYGYYGCLALASGVVLWESKTGLRGRHEDYRALAEALRVQFFWMAAGLTDLAADQYLRKQAGETVWIRDAVGECALFQGVLSLSPPEPEGRGARLRLAHKWVVSQRSYFARTRNKHEKKKRWFGIAATIAGTIGLALPITGMHFHLTVWTESTAAVAMWWAALAWDYVERRGFTQEARQYSRMHDLFRDADQDLEELEADGQFEASEETLRELGREALAENADWLAMHRERKLSANLAAK